MNLGPPALEAWSLNDWTATEVPDSHIILKCIVSPSSMHDTGCLGLVHWDNPEGWYGEIGGFGMGNTCIPVADLH